MPTVAKVGIGAAVLGAAGLILYFTCGKGGQKAAEGAKDVAEKAKEALVDTKKYFDTSIDDFKKAGNTFKNGKAVTPDGAVTEYTGYRNGKEVKLFEPYDQGDKILVKQGKNIVTMHSKSVDGKDVLTRNELFSL